MRFVGFRKVTPAEPFSCGGHSPLLLHDMFLCWLLGTHCTKKIFSTFQFKTQSVVTLTHSLVCVVVMPDNAEHGQKSVIAIFL